MEDLFSLLHRQKHLDEYKISLLSATHPFTGDEIVKWKDKLLFNRIVFNRNVKWTLEALCEVKDLLKWECLVLKDLSIDDFSILLSLKPYIEQMTIRRKIMLAECILDHKISLQEANDLVGPTATCLASNCLLGVQILEEYKDDKSLDWKLISKFYELTPEIYKKYKKYWVEDELLVNSSIFSDYQLVQLFSNKINWANRHHRYIENPRFFKFAISYPEYEHLNWSKLSIHKNAVEYILNEPDFPFWDWELIYRMMDLNTFHQLKEIIFKRDKGYEMHYNSNPVFLTQQYIERIPLDLYRRSGANKFPQLDEVEERALGIQSVFLKIGCCYEIPLALFEKYYVKDEMIKLWGYQLGDFWKNNSSNLTVAFLSQNTYIIDHLLVADKPFIYRVPIETIRTYPALIICRDNICKPINLRWRDVVDSYLNSDSIFHPNYFGDADPAIYQLLMNQYNNDLDNLFSEMSHTV